MANNKVVSEFNGRKGWRRSTALNDLLDVYDLCNRSVQEGAFRGTHPDVVRNAFQVVRYAFREWAVGKRDERVLNALMYGELKEKYFDPIQHEVTYFVEDESQAKAIEDLLKDKGFEELR
jgi:hypothetical protein